MAVQSLIQFKQGATTGAPGVAITGVLTTQVQASNGGVGDVVLTYKWTWIDTPPGSAIPRGLITEGNVPQIVFAPDVVGDYHLELVVYGINGFFSTDRRVFRVPRATARAIPAFDAEAPALNFLGNTRGWAPDMETWLTYLDSLAPGGSTGYMQYNSGTTPGFAGTSLLTVTGSPAFLTFTGKPLHQEDYSRFSVASGSGSEARSQWGEVTTTDGSAHVLCSLSLPNATYGDCIITVIAEASVSVAGGHGGNRALKSVWKRVSGVLSNVGEDDLSSSDLFDGTAVGGLSTSNPDNDTISLNGTGINATTVKWFGSVHVILRKA